MNQPPTAGTVSAETETEFTRTSRELHMELNRLESLVNSLPGRLSLVIVDVPVPNSPNKEQPKLEPLRSSLGIFLVEKAQQVHTLNDTLENLIESLRI